jgi:hypothetical protein
VTIVKASYTRALADAKRYVRYIAHRSAGRPGRVTRELWNDQGRIDRLRAFEMLDRQPQGRGTSYFRFAISPDPRAEDIRRDLDVRALTSRTMRELEDRLGRSVEWVAALHDDHADHRHTHVLAVVRGSVRSDDLRALAAEATSVAREQRRRLDHERGPEHGIRGTRDAAAERNRERGPTAPPTRAPAPPEVQP